MQNLRPGTIKGLSIAVIVLSILSIVGCFILFALLGMVNDVFQNYAYYPEVAMELEASGISEAEALQIMGIMSSVGGVLIFVLLVVSAVSLVAGILGVKNASNPLNLGACFGWSIAGAIVSFLCGNIILTILLIILAVVINGDKKVAKILAAQQSTLESAATTGQPVAQVPTAQPQVAPSAVQAAAPTQPVAPAVQQTEQPAANAIQQTDTQQQ